MRVIVSHQPSKLHVHAIQSCTSHNILPNDKSSNDRAQLLPILVVAHLVRALWSAGIYKLSKLWPYSPPLCSGTQWFSEVLNRGPLLLIANYRPNPSSGFGHWQFLDFSSRSSVSLFRRSLCLWHNWVRSRCSRVVDEMNGLICNMIPEWCM